MVRARRQWAQHWLANDELAEALVRQVAPGEGDRFVEIGAGRGSLTTALLRRPIHVVAVEVDPRCVELLRDLGSGDRLTVVQSDILELDLGELAADVPVRIVGNLPYNLTSPILRWTVRHRGGVRDAHYMVPADVARRVLASPGSREYGLLSVEVGWRFEGQELRRLGPGAFRPEPEIDSSFIRLTPADPPPCRSSERHRRAVVEAAFAHRRKTLSNALALGGWPKEDAVEACRRAEIEPRARAETLAVEDFARLAEEIPER